MCILSPSISPHWHVFLVGRWQGSKHARPKNPPQHAAPARLCGARPSVATHTLPDFRAAIVCAAASQNHLSNLETRRFPLLFIGMAANPLAGLIGAN